MLSKRQHGALRRWVFGHIRRMLIDVNCVEEHPQGMRWICEAAMGECVAREQGHVGIKRFCRCEHQPEPAGAVTAIGVFGYAGIDMDVGTVDDDHVPGRCGMQRLGHGRQDRVWLRGRQGGSPRGLGLGRQATEISATITAPALEAL